MCSNFLGGLLIVLFGWGGNGIALAEVDKDIYFAKGKKYGKLWAIFIIATLVIPYAFVSWALYNKIKSTFKTIKEDIMKLYIENQLYEVDIIMPDLSDVELRTSNGDIIHPAILKDSIEMAMLKNHNSDPNFRLVDQSRLVEDINDMPSGISMLGRVKRVAIDCHTAKIFMSVEKGKWLLREMIPEEFRAKIAITPLVFINATTREIKIPAFTIFMKHHDEMSKLVTVIIQAGIIEEK